MEILTRGSGVWHADRAAPFQSYCAGLLLPGDRKSVEPMAARVQPGRVQAAHQPLRARVLPVIERHGAIRALLVDDTGSPKKGPAVALARMASTAMRDEDIMRHTRHRDLRTMRGYVQRAGLVSDSPAGVLDL